MRSDLETTPFTTYDNNTRALPAPAVTQAASRLRLHGGLLLLLLVVLPVLGWVYLIPVAWVTADLFWRNLKLIHTPTPQYARGLFMSSNIYLLVLLLAICAGTVATSLAA